MRICLIASSRFPVREPFAGGLEAVTHSLASKLASRGHRVTLFAGPGSDPALPVEVLESPVFEPSRVASADVNAPPSVWMAQHHAYLTLMLRLAGADRDRFDVVHNNSLHHLPVAMAPMLTVPVVTTLHTPPTPWLESAILAAPGGCTFTAVSEWTSLAWSHAVASTPVLNGVDLDAWPAGPGGGPAVWTGRLVPEKAPHDAIDAARLAGVPLVLAGPLSDEGYFEREIAPRLGPGAAYLGHLDHRAIGGLLRRASVAVVTPEWDEPYGLVAAEAMASGAPVAAYARGALPELVTDEVGALATPGDVGSLAEAIRRSLGRDRAAVRRHAEAEFSVDRMVRAYEDCYAAVVRRGFAA